MSDGREWYDRLEGSKVQMGPFTLTPESRVESTWNTAYPDRRPWSKIGTEAQAEWRRVFAIYDSLKP
jgi:hypothetical protein